jgi:hypothetical protein
MREETIETDRRKLLLDALKLVYAPQEKEKT